MDTTNAISQIKKGSNLEEGVTDNGASNNTSNNLNLTTISRKIVLNVFHNLSQTTYQSLAVKKTSELTNVSTSAIYKLIKEGITAKYTRSVNPKIAAVIEDAILEFQSSGKIITLKGIRRFIKLKLPNITPSLSTLNLWIKKLGYRCAVVPSFASREALKDFLSLHNLPFEENYTKKELMNVLAKYRYKSKKYILYKSAPKGSVQNVS